MDNLDMQILSRLLNNCRESDRQIGRNLGISGGAVRARTKRMLKGGVIERFMLKIEPPVLGYGVFYIVAAGRDLDDMLAQVRLVGEPFLVVPCIGGVTVCGIAVKDSVQKRIGLARGIMRDVRVLSIFEAKGPGAGPDLTRTDLAIIDVLLRDPRQRMEAVAREAGLSTKTVARSIEKLQGNEAIQFTLVYEPTHIEGYIPHAILAQVSGDLDGTLARLREGFSGSFLQIPFVAKNQVVLFMYSGSIFDIDDLAERVRQTPGVDSTDLFIPKKIAFPQEWMRQSISDAGRSPTLHLMYREAGRPVQD